MFMQICICWFDFYNTFPFSTGMLSQHQQLQWPSVCPMTFGQRWRNVVLMMTTLCQRSANACVPTFAERQCDNIGSNQYPVMQTNGVKYTTEANIVPCPKIALTARVVQNGMWLEWMYVWMVRCSSFTKYLKLTTPIHEYLVHTWSQGAYYGIIWKHGLW